MTSEPGEKALSLLKLNKDLGLFKVPKVPVKRKQKVLDEDTYLEEMGKIIQRDFFPDLEKLRAQNEYLDAQSQNDSVRMMQIYAKYSSGRRPPTERAPSPATFETPLQPREPSDLVEESNLEMNKLRKENEERSKKTSSAQDEDDLCSVTDEVNRDDKMKPVKKRLSLDQYLASHTSEDNESFKEIQREAIMKHKMKYSWLYKDENVINNCLKDKLEVPSIEQQASETTKPLEIDTWTYKNLNPCMYVPEGVELSDQEKTEMARKKHEIVYENTRLEKLPFDERQNKDVIQELALNQAKNQLGKIGVDGKVVTSVETPKVNGFSFVRTPSPAPGVNESPLITWGEIEGTPFRLDGSDTPYTPSPGPTFRIPEVPKREKIAMALADKVSESYRDKKRKAIEAARFHLAGQSPRGSSFDRLSEMSPAAQRLASASLGHRLGTDTALRNSYSPSPKLPSPRTPYLTPSPKTTKLSKTPNTPISSPNVKLKGVVRRSTPVNVTDDLLKLPRLGANRPKAADFF